MKVETGILIEGESAPLLNWVRRLGSAEICSALQEGGALNRVRPGGATLRLDFVGLIIARSSAFFALPKIYAGQMPKAGTEISRAIGLTLGCLQRYERKTPVRGDLGAVFAESDFTRGGERILDIFLRLLRWTLDHGLHGAEQVCFSDDPADALWDRMARDSVPIHKRGSSYYVDFVGERTISRHTQTAFIQAFALLSLVDRLGVVAEIWISPLDPVLEDCRDFLANWGPDFLTPAQMTEHIDEAVAATSRDHDRDLLNILAAWMESRRLEDKAPIFYGTNAFHVVWEDICLALMGASDGPPAHAALASQPRYAFGDQEVLIGPQRPDYFRRDGDAAWIADAKWYANEDLPKLGDAIKQLAYQMTLAPSLKVQANCFLLPHLGEPHLRPSGSLAMASHGGPDLRFPTISLISIDWTYAAETYQGERASIAQQVFDLASKFP